jgi:competence protein ComEC
MQFKTYKYPFIFISLCFILGIMAGKYLIHFPHSLWLTSILFCLCIVFIRTKRTTVLIGMIFCTLICAASLRYHLTTEIFPNDHITGIKTDYVNQYEGVVIDYQYKKDHSNKYLISLNKICLPDTHLLIRGEILLFTKKIEERYTYGDRIRVHASLHYPSGKRNPGQFDYRQYLISKNIYHISKVMHSDSIKVNGKNNGNWIIGKVIIPLRKYCLEMFQKYFEDQTAGLIMALILGEKQDLDRGMIDNFKKVGGVHVLAICGLHVGFIITFIFSLLSLFRLNTPAKIWGLLGVLVIYIILVRFKTPVIRASAMAILYLFGLILERKTSTYNIIFAAMTIILLFDPRELFNPGFHFSFMAVLSIIFGYDKLDQLLPLNRSIEERAKKSRTLSYFRKWVWMPFLVSLSAVIGTSPLTLYYYGLFPMYALLANLIVIPLTGVVVFLCLFLLFVGALSDILANGVAKMIQLVNLGLQYVVDAFANLPLAAVLTPIPTIFQIILLYMVILIGLNARKNLKYASMLIPLISLIFFITSKTGAQKDLQVAFLDVGQGDAAFLRFPNQRTMLIDAGNSSFQWDQGKKTILPFLQSMHSLHLTYLVGSHPHNDHIGGTLALINSLSIDTLVLSAYPFHSELYENLISTAMQKSIPLKVVYKGDWLKPDPSCRVYVLHPDSTYTQSETFSGAECNNSSVVLKVTYGSNSVLFTGDLEETGEHPLLKYEDFLESEIIKIGHHGSKTSTSEALLRHVNPIVALISVAKKNKFKHPSPVTLRRLKRYGIMTYQTSQEGAVIFSIGPERIRKVNWK